MLSTQSAALPAALGLPEVGVESTIEVPDIAAVHMAARQLYPRSYPLQPWGYTPLFAPLLERRARRMSRRDHGPESGLNAGNLSYLSWVTI